MPTQLTIKGRTYQLPLYIPDATLGVVRGLDSADLARIGLTGLMVNTYHLYQIFGADKMRHLGGIKTLMGWSGLIASDSGGFQLFSLIQKNPDLGKITDEGVVLYTGVKKQRKILFTPEESIRMQFAIGSDIMICLDDFTPPGAAAPRIADSVQRTIDWARRSKSEFDRQLELHGYSPTNRPLLLAPIQGHADQAQRARCATALQQLNFDIYGLGGWPFDAAGKFDYDFCAYNAQLTATDSLRFALGVGSPFDIVKLFFMGYQFFDCVLPTRDARHQRLYLWKVDPQTLDRAALQAAAAADQLQEIFDYLYIGKGQYASDQQPLSPHTDATPVSRAYLHHLFKIKDTSAMRLASLHNLRVYTQLMEVLQRE